MAERFRVTSSAEGLELYFPPLRRPLAAARLALFGAACLLLGLFATAGVLPLAHTGAAEALTAWLMSAFIAPFIAFGIGFPLLAAYGVANSLTVSISRQAIRSRRRVLGIALPERSLRCEDVATLRSMEEARYLWLLDKQRQYRIVAAPKGNDFDPAATPMRRVLAVCRHHRLTVAESLCGKSELDAVSAAIARAAGIAPISQPQ